MKCGLWLGSCTHNLQKEHQPETNVRTGNLVGLSIIYLGAVIYDGGVDIDAVRPEAAVAVHAAELRDAAYRRHQGPQDDIIQDALHHMTGYAAAQ